MHLITDNNPIYADNTQLFKSQKPPIIKICPNKIIGGSKMKNISLKKFKARVSYLTVCVLTVFILAGAVPQKAFAEPIQPKFPMVSGMQKLRDGVFVSTGEYEKVNGGLIVSGNEAAIIDTGLFYEGYTPNEALRVKQYLEKNNLKLKYIFITHQHSDHNSNLAMFQNDDTVIYDPSNTQDSQLISLGTKIFKILRTSGHFYDEHISIELVKEKILFAGDVVVTCLPTAVAFGGDFKGLVPTLEMLRTKNYSIIVPGHGDIINPHEAIRMNLEYLKNVKKYVNRIINDGGTLEDVLKISLNDCLKNIKYLNMESADRIHQWNLETAYDEFLKEK
jgi:glyoxylase-like metal-dependent hydrolase (beta-lactamase superfamily II)